MNKNTNSDKRVYATSGKRNRLLIGVSIEVAVCRAHTQCRCQCHTTQYKSMITPLLAPPLPQLLPATVIPTVSSNHLLIGIISEVAV